MLCPNCREAINPASFVCSNKHQFAHEDGVFVLLEEDFGRRLRAFTDGFSALRAAENKRLLDTSAYEKLPFAEAVNGNTEWRLRGYDLAVIRKLLSRREPQRVLDVGAWNGWLSHRLAAQGHHVTAIDYFTDKYDGLGAKKFYSTGWQPIQMDLTDLSVLSECYDVVILNRCVQFFANPVAYATAVKQYVAPGGLLVLTGLQFFHDTQEKARSITALRAYLNSHGLDFFKPMKGYLDFADKQHLRAQGVLFRHYPQLWLANLKSMLKRNLPRHYYGVWFHPEKRSSGVERIY